MSVRLADLLEEFKAKPDPSVDEPEVLTLTERNGFVRQSERFSKRLAVENTSNYKLLGRSDIAFNPYLLWAGAIAQNTQWDQAIISPLYPTFHVREGYCPEFVIRLLLTDQMIKRYDGIAYGSVPRKRRTTVQDFLGLEVPDPPPLPEQRRIAAILDHADALRAKRREAVACLDELALSVFHDIFGDLSSYEVRRLSEISQVTSGLTKGRRLSANASTRSVPYLAVVNVQDRRFELSQPKVILATEQEIERYRLRRDDLLLTEGGDPDKLGRGSVWRDELPEAIHQNHIFKVRLSVPDISPVFLNWVISSAYGKAYFLRSAKQTTGIASINSSQLKAFPVPVAARCQQERFERHLAETVSARDHALASVSALDSLFSSLQSRAFRGAL
ncbi:hypothetical protein R4227_18225 [Gordonia amicalis]|uniref:restriction endonuclease subunit S n=1 Tax=Gordonia amicalis TaxID=89053 RepID=UPI0029547433|nr:hypothetical protein [Gordonia amicalis]MDV7101999.1 hypothetical protein [Gordonia amicalis]